MSYKWKHQQQSIRRYHHVTLHLGIPGTFCGAMMVPMAASGGEWREQEALAQTNQGAEI